MQQSLKNLKKQLGYSLIEVIIAIAILGVSLTGMVTAVQQMIVQSYSQVDATMIYEDDLMIRYEISRVLQIFQREIVKRLPSGSRSQAAVEQFQCSEPWNLMQNIQTGTFIDHPVGSRRIYFGQWDDISGIIPAATRISDSQMALFTADPPFDRVLGTSPSTLLARPRYQESQQIFDAYSRCRNQSIGSGVSSIQGRDTIYLCGYGVGFLVEIQATFWDSNVRNPIDCEKMNLVTGRGIQAVYKVYGFAKSKIKKVNVPNSSGFIFKSYGGRIYIPKDIFYGDD